MMSLFLIGQRAEPFLVRASSLKQHPIIYKWGNPQTLLCFIISISLSSILRCIAATPLDCYYLKTSPGLQELHKSGKCACPWLRIPYLVPSWGGYAPRIFRSTVLIFSASSLVPYTCTHILTSMKFIGCYLRRIWMYHTNRVKTWEPMFLCLNNHTQGSQERYLLDTS